MSRAKLFIENFLVYGLAGIIGKAIPVIMVPIITRLISDTSIYGVYDLLRVLVSFGSAFAVLGMYDAMFRMFFDKETEEYKKKVCSSSLIVVSFSSIIVGFFIIIFSKSFSRLLFSTDEYCIWVMLMGLQTAFGALGSIIAAPTRMQNKRKVFVTLSVVTPMISYGVSITLILLVDPFMGLIFGAFASVLARLIIFWMLNSKWFSLKLVDRSLAIEMLKIGLPLMPTFIIYWVFSSFDRIMISNILGTSQNGIYAVGSKMAQVSQLIYTAFAGGWAYFTYSTMKDEDHSRMISKVYEYLGIISFVSTILLTPMIPSLFKVLFAGDYVKGYKVAPYLFLSPLLLMLFQTSSSQLLVIKKSYWVTISLVAGALLNIVLNLFLIPILGIEGAAIATLLGYTFSVVFTAIITVKKNILLIKIRFIISAILTTVFFIASKLIFNRNLFIWILSAFIIIIISMLYIEDIKKFKSKILRSGK